METEAQGLNDREIGGGIPLGTRDSSFLNPLQIGSEFSSLKTKTQN
jgi:hypothetical protein